MTTPITVDSWKAKSWKQACAVWADLVDEAGPHLGEQLLNEQEAGTLFERLVLEAFRLSGVAGSYSFTVPSGVAPQPREEIDGMVWDAWQGFLVESKFWRSKVNFGPIARLHVLVDQRPAGTIGLIFSAFGYTAQAVETADLLHPIRVLLFDQQDLMWAFGCKRPQMLEVLQRKWRNALMFGRPALPVETEHPLFK